MVIFSSLTATMLYPPKYVRRTLWVLLAMLVVDVACNAVGVAHVNSKAALLASSMFVFIILLLSLRFDD